MKVIPLNRGYSAIVDDEDYSLVSQFHWHALVKPNRVCAALSKNHEKQFGTIYMHRILMKPPKNMVVDHINHDALDNRRCNLRVCTHSQNHANQRKRKKNSSRFKGVRYSHYQQGKKRWEALIGWKGRQRFIGKFNNEEDAAIAYNVAAQLFFGPFACLNDV